MKNLESTTITLTQEEVVALLKEPGKAPAGLVKKVEQASGMRGPVTLNANGAQLTARPRWDSPAGEPQVYLGAPFFSVQEVRTWATDLLGALDAWEQALKRS